MNIQQIKQQISAITGVPIIALNMVRQMTQETQGTETPEPTEWLSHWDNDNRIRVTMHENVLKTIKDDPKVNVLALKNTLVEAEGQPGDDAYRAAYRRFVVITPNFIEASF